MNYGLCEVQVVTGMEIQSHWKELRKDGLMPKHAPPQTPRGTVCPGSGKRPVTVKRFDYDESR